MVTRATEVSPQENNNVNIYKRMQQDRFTVLKEVLPIIKKVKPLIVNADSLNVEYNKIDPAIKFELISHDIAAQIAALENSEIRQLALDLFNQIKGLQSSKKIPELVCILEKLPYSFMFINNPDIYDADIFDPLAERLLYFAKKFDAEKTAPKSSLGIFLFPILLSLGLALGGLILSLSLTGSLAFPIFFGVFAMLAAILCLVTVVIHIIERNEAAKQRQHDVEHQQNTLSSKLGLFAEKIRESNKKPVAAVNDAVQANATDQAKQESQPLLAPTSHCG